MALVIQGDFFDFSYEIAMHLHHGNKQGLLFIECLLCDTQDRVASSPGLLT